MSKPRFRLIYIKWDRWVSHPMNYEAETLHFIRYGLPLTSARRWPKPEPTK